MARPGVSGSSRRTAMARCRLRHSRRCGRGATPTTCCWVTAWVVRPIRPGGSSRRSPGSPVIDPGPPIILGAGPTGLGAAYRLQERGVDDFTVVEARAEPGGLASSYVDARGFTWDVGGHVQFSHYAYYDDLLDRALAD